jgi:transcriptional regulator with XRE-family HTH domain
MAERKNPRDARKRSSKESPTASGGSVRGDAFEVGRRIAEARKRAGYDTVAAFQRQTRQVDERDKKGISQPTLAGYEAGKFLPGGRELKLLCMALKVSPNWLLFGQQAFPAATNPAAHQDDLIAKLLETGNANQQSMMIGALLPFLRDHERLAIGAIVEMVLRGRMGDKGFAGQLEIAKSMTELVFGSQSPLRGAGPDLLAGTEPLLDRVHRVFQNVAGPEDIDPGSK